jgi:hypothetical protein
MLVTGGQTTAGLDLDDAWALSLDGGTAWSPLPASANHQISSHSEIYDPTGDRLIRFGGWNGDTNSDSWELPLAVPPLTLAPLDPLGFPPPSRMNHAAVFDALGTRMLIFGGITTGQGDVEVYQLPVAPVTLSTPLSRPGPGVRLAEAYPDPASSDVSIRFTLPSAAHATLHIYDVSGRRVATLAEGLHAAGPHTLRWDRRATSGAKVRPGLYFYEVSALGARIAKRVVLIE